MSLPEPTGTVSSRMQDAASSNSELVTTSDAAIVSEEDDRDHDLCKSIPRTSNIIHNVRLNAFTQELIGTEVEKEIVDMAHELYELFDEPSFREERRTALVVVLIYLAYQQQDRHVDLYHLMRLRGMTINDIGDVREIYQKCCENRNVSLHFFDSTPPRFDDWIGTTPSYIRFHQLTMHSHRL